MKSIGARSELHYLQGCYKDKWDNGWKILWAHTDYSFLLPRLYFLPWDHSCGGCAGRACTHFSHGHCLNDKCFLDSCSTPRMDYSIEGSHKILRIDAKNLLTQGGCRKHDEVSELEFGPISLHIPDTVTGVDSTSHRFNIHCWHRNK